MLLDISKFETMEEIEGFLTRSLSTIAYNNGDIKSIKRNEFDYILKLGFLKVDLHKSNRESGSYEFFHEIVKKNFIAIYLFSIDFSESREYIIRSFIELSEKISNGSKLEDISEEIEVLVFLNRLSIDYTHNNISKDISKRSLDLFAEQENKRDEISFFAKTKLIIPNFEQRLEEYLDFIADLDNIDQGFFESQLEKIIENHKLLNC